MLHLAPADERDDPGERIGKGEAGVEMPDRRESAFNDPRFWVSVTAILLTVSLAVLGFIATQLSSISTDVRAMVVTGASQGKDIEALKKENVELRQELAAQRLLIDGNEKAQRDYNFKMSNDMQKIVTLLGMRKGETP